MSSRPTAGVTLLELLIAVTLVSLLSVGMLMAMRVSLNALDKADQRLYTNRRAVSVQRILERQISAAMPVTTLCPSSAGAPPAPVSFFHGDQSSLGLVSSYSMWEGWRGYPRLLEYQVIARQRGDGVRLVVNEHLYTGPTAGEPFCLDLKFRPVEAGPGSFVLADRLAYCRFWYRELLPGGQADRWLPLWNQPNLPTAVRVEMAPLELDPTGIPLQTITVPIRVTRDVSGVYDDK